MKCNILVAVLFIIICSCQPDTIPVKREMRGVWVASVKNIDWPSKPMHSTLKLKEEYRKIAAFHQQNGMNAMIVQVRPATDAFYPSKTEVWSEWLSGEQGLPPEPLFDPLDFMIEETHNRGMEFHAWFNPYRALVDADSAKSAINHITVLRPGWFVRYGENLYFDPGIPEARAYLVQAIGEVVRNYDVDAIHFDDYFYPYKIPGLEFPDSLSFNKNGRDFQTVSDWRRNNVNLLIEELNEEIKSIKPFVKFGISPFGVWRNIDNDPDGSQTRAGQTNYDDLYADVLLWMKNGWIDYIVPQIYWHIGFDLADYSILVDWWNNHSYGIHTYIGQASYRIGNDRAPEWSDPSELFDHLRLNQNYPNIRGDVYFNTSSFFSNSLGFVDTLRSERYASPALMPTMPWVDDTPPQPPIIGRWTLGRSGPFLEWSSRDKETAYFLIYRFRGKEVGNLDDPRNIVAKIRYPESNWVDNSLKKKGKYTYVITAIDRNNNESESSIFLTIENR